MSAKLAGIGKTMTVVGGVVTAAFGAIVMKTAAVGNQFDKMSLRTGVTVENLSALAYAADICGTDIGTVEKGLKGLTKTMADAADGVGEGLDAFIELDIAVVDTEGNLRPTVEVLKEAATKISAIENPTKQAALAMDLFGAKAGPQLLPLLKQGGDGIEELMGKAEQLGITMSTEAATAAAEFTDRLADLKGSLAGAGREIGNVLIPIITPLIEKVVKVVGKIKEWAKENKFLVEMIVKVAATLGVMAAVGGPILLAVSAFMKMKVAITAVSVAVKALAISSGPIGWLILAAGALYLAWQTNFGGIRDFTIAVVGAVTEALGWLWDKVKWVLEKLGLYKETIEPVNEANEELATSTDKVATASEEAATAADTFTTANDLLGDSLGGIQEKAKEAGEAIRLYADDVTDNYIALATKAGDSWEDFYAFWEAEAKRVAAETKRLAEETSKEIEKVVKKLIKVKDTAGAITIETDYGIQHAGSLEEAQAIVAGNTPSYAAGTPYVPRTELAMVHKGEKITPANQNTNNNSYSPTVNITVAGNGNVSEIKQAVEQALQESARQYSRSGNVLIPGMA